MLVNTRASAAVQTSASRAAISASANAIPAAPAPTTR